MSKALKFFSTLGFAIFLGLTTPGIVLAQMFSGDEGANRTTGYQDRGIAFSAGVQFADFSYRPIDEPGGELEFKSELLALQLDLGGIDIYSQIGRGLYSATGLELSTFMIGANLGNVFPLLVKDRFKLLVPLTLTTDYLRVSRDQARSEFQQSSIQIAGGGEVILGGAGGRGPDRGVFSGGASGRNRPTPILQIKGEPFVGFSYSQGSLFGGGLRGFRAEATVSRIGITSRFSMRAGYRYQYRAYNIDGTLYDYALKGHTLLMGVEF